MKLKIFKNKQIKGFSLVELLLALAIFGIVMVSNFGLAIDAYRSRENDRTRLEAGLVIKDSINGVYTYKNNSWAEIIKYFDQDPLGTTSRRLDFVSNKLQINQGTKTENGITYEIYFKKAQRDELNNNLVANNDGTDPDTMKITVIASWTDILGVTQQLSENYFLTNWSSETWTETTNAEFTDSINLDPTPVLNLTKVEADSVKVDSATVYANSDWCPVLENTDIRSYDLFPTGSGNTQTLGVNSNTSEVEYEVYEPDYSGPNPTNIPAPVAPSLPPVNNNNASICNGANGISSTQCETLIRLYDSTNGDSWTISTNWTMNSTPCDLTYGWLGITCSGGNVTSISLPSNSLTGTIPTEIGNLTGLTTLDLSGNAITGSIPPQIGRMTSLTSLNLSNNLIEGVIPHTIGILSSLTTLNLSNNLLEGAIPTTLGRLTALTSLMLDNNSLSCHVPLQIVNLSNITNGNINLSGNNIILPSRVSIVDTYLDTKNADIDPSDPVVYHEDCMSRPASDKVYISQYNTTENESLDSTYLEAFESESFYPTMQKTLLENPNWIGEDESSALSFDGEDVVRVGYAPHWNFSEEMTIMTWIKSMDPSQDTYDRIIDFSNSADNSGWFLSFAIPNKIYFKHYGSVLNDDFVLQTGTPITEGDWTHIAVVLSGGTGTMYIDGANITSDTYPELKPVAGTSQELRFGNSSTLPLITNGSEIVMDDIRIYKRALSQNEIQKSYHVEVSRSDPDLIGYWRFNLKSSESPQTFYDYSSFSNLANRGSVNGTPDSADPTIIFPPDIQPNNYRAKYRINDITKYNNKLYMSTSHPDNDVVVYDTTNDTTAIIDVTSIVASNHDTVGVVIQSDTRGFIFQDKYIVQFNPSNNSIGDLQNLSTNNGITNIVDMSFDTTSNLLYMIGLNYDKNFAVMDVTNGITPTPVVKNLLMEAFL